jgi:hypothetical protein
LRLRFLPFAGIRGVRTNGWFTGEIPVSQPIQKVLSGRETYVTVIGGVPLTRKVGSCKELDCLLTENGCGKRRFQTGF